MVIDIVIASGSSISGRLSVRWVKICGIKGIKFNTNPVINAGTARAKLIIVIAPNFNRLKMTLMGSKINVLRSSNIGDRGVRNCVNSPIKMGRVTIGNPDNAPKIGIATVNIKPMKSAKGIKNRRGRVSIR